MGSNPEKPIRIRRELVGFWSFPDVQYLQHNENFWKHRQRPQVRKLKSTSTVGCIRKKCQLNEVRSFCEFQLCRLFPSFSLEEFVKCSVLFDKLDHIYSTTFGISKLIRNLKRIAHILSPIHQVLSKSFLPHFWRTPPCIFLATLASAFGATFNVEFQVSNSRINTAKIVLLDHSIRRKTG